MIRFTFTFYNEQFFYVGLLYSYSLFFFFEPGIENIFSIIYCSLRVSWLFSIFSSLELTVKAFINVDTNFKYTAASLYKTITFYNICTAIFFYQVLWFYILFCVTVLWVERHFLCLFHMWCGREAVKMIDLLMILHMMAYSRFNVMT